MIDADKFGIELADIIKAAMAKANAPLVERLDHAEARIAAIEAALGTVGKHLKGKPK